MLFVRTLVGAVIVLLVAAVTGGLQFVVLSVVCTAGLGLVFWLPVSWFAGWLVTAGWRDRPPDREASWAGDSREQTAMYLAALTDGEGRDALLGCSRAEAYRAVQYVRQARRQGRGDAEIRDNMLRAGWYPALVEDLLGMDAHAGVPGAEPPPIPAGR